MAGICIEWSSAKSDEGEWRGSLSRLGLDDVIECRRDRPGEALVLALRAEHASRPWSASGDTLDLAAGYGLPDTPEGLLRETLISMAASPLVLRFSSTAEFEAALRIRRNVAFAARQACLRFDTHAVDRPESFWSYDEEAGFRLRHGRALIPALRAALFPASDGRAYSFSCYRATEYVQLLGLAQELETSHPEQLLALESIWRTGPIASRRFHDTFLNEVGSAEAPLPMHHYVPGDRVWFRNPDEASADVAGYEGSWVIYLGRGRFCNFWKPHEPYLLRDKCLEMYCWRYGLRSEGEPWIDESLVDQHVLRLKADPREAERAVQAMMRYRDPSGVYADGGCVDSTREHVKSIEELQPLLVELRAA